MSAPAIQYIFTAYKSIVLHNVRSIIYVIVYRFAFANAMLSSVPAVALLRFGANAIPTIEKRRSTVADEAVGRRRPPRARAPEG